MKSSKPTKSNISNTSSKSGATRVVVGVSVLFGVLSLISSIVTLAVSFVASYSSHKRALRYASLILTTIFVGFFVCALLAKYVEGSERSAIAESHRKNLGLTLKESKQKVKQIDKAIKYLNNCRDRDLSLLDSSYNIEFNSAKGNGRDTRSIEKEYVGRRKAKLEDRNKEIKLLLDEKIKYHRCVNGKSISNEQIEEILRDPLDVNAKVPYFDRVEFSEVRNDDVLASDEDVNLKRGFVAKCVDPINHWKSALCSSDSVVVSDVAWSGKMGMSGFVYKQIIYKESNPLITGIRVRGDFIFRKSKVLYTCLPSDRVQYSTYKEESRKIIKAHLENYYMGILCGNDPCSIYSLKAAEISASGGGKINTFSDVKVSLPIIEVKRFADYGFRSPIEASLEVFCEKFGLNNNGELTSACSLGIGTISVMTGNDKIDNILRDRGYMNRFNDSPQLMLPVDMKAQLRSPDHDEPSTNQSGVRIKQVNEKHTEFVW